MLLSQDEVRLLVDVCTGELARLGDDYSENQEGDWLARRVEAVGALRDRLKSQQFGLDEEAR